MKDDGIAAESILTKEHCDRIRDHLICEVFSTIADELEIDPEGGAFLLAVHLEGARKASH